MSNNPTDGSNFDSSEHRTDNTAPQAKPENQPVVGEIIDDGLIFDVETDETAASGEERAVADMTDETGAQQNANDVEPPTAAVDSSSTTTEIGNGAAFAQQIQTLEQKLADTEKEKTEFWDRLLRTTADFDNFRKRARRDVDDARTDAQMKVLREMLPVIDNLERAVEHSISLGHGDDLEAKGLIDGVQLVLRQFSQALERFEVRALDSVGKPFDPNFHEAVAQTESNEFAAGIVAVAYQRGYVIGQRLLRPAMVVVSKGPGPQTTQNDAGSNLVDAEETGETAKNSANAQDFDSAGESADIADASADTDFDIDVDSDSTIETASSSRSSETSSSRSSETSSSRSSETSSSTSTADSSESGGRE